MDRAPLRELLRAHEPSDATEADHVARVLALLDGELDPFARSSCSPGHVTASAFVLSPDGGSLLLILHGKLGIWVQPGGHIDADDVDIVAAARREASEETGLTDLTLEPGFPDLLDVDIHGIPANPSKGEPAHEHHDVRILLRAGSVEHAAGSDAADARWVPLEQVQDAGTDDSVRRAVRKLLGRRSAEGA